MALTQQPVTAEEFLAVDEERRWTELIEGVVVVNEPSWSHQVILGRLHVALFAWVADAPGRGTVSLSVDVLMNQANMFGPDAMWFAEGRAPAWHQPRSPDTRPDLAIELRSPNTWRYDVGAKRRVYEEGVLPEVWLVDIKAETVLVFRRSRPGGPAFDVALEVGGDATLASPQLPGFELPVADLFARD